MQWLFHWNGNYFGYVRGGNIFTGAGNHVGWIEGDSAWKANGTYLGQLIPGGYITRREGQRLPLRKLPRLPLLPQLPPLPPLARLGRFPVWGVIDALEELS